MIIEVLSWKSKINYVTINPGDVMEEIWKEIPGYENYQISNFGRRKKGNKILKPLLFPNGYVNCAVWKNNKQKVYLMHRMVMELFHPDKSDFKSMPYEDRDKIDLNKLEVNHKDECVTNNHVDNLEWCTSKYNANYGNRNIKCRLCNKRFFKPVEKYTLDGKLLNVYDTISDAAKSVNGDSSFIARVCNNKQLTAYGYKWQWHN